MHTIDDYNYATDSRTQGAVQRPKLSFYGCGTCGTAGESCDCPAAPEGVDPVNGTHFYGMDIEEELPMKWGVCHVCDGNGKHVNPSIDSGGISAEQFHDDPDFAESYMRGDYDQTCNACSGRTTVPVVDWDALDPAHRKAYEDQLQEEADDRAQHLAEIRMGA